jgi:hypothetical protein
MSENEVKKVEIIFPLIIKDVEAMQFGLIHTGFETHLTMGSNLSLSYENMRVGIFNPYPKNVEYNNRCAEQEGKPKKGSIDLYDKYSYFEEKIKKAYAIGAITKQANKMWWKAEIRKSQTSFLGTTIGETFYIKLVHHKKSGEIEIKVREDNIVEIKVIDFSDLSFAIEKLIENIIKVVGNEISIKIRKPASDNQYHINLPDPAYSSNEQIQNTAVRLPVIEKLSWDILPKGEWSLEQIIKHFKELNCKKRWKEKRFDKTRIERICNHLNPATLYIGREQFEGYVVFCFDWTEKAVLECPIYGNAIYVINSEWEKISKLSKWEARKKYSNQVSVINHTDTWLKRLSVNLRNPF